MKTIYKYHVPTENTTHVISLLTGARILYGDYQPNAGLCIWA
jgi:hypothetical protein